MDAIKKEFSDPPIIGCLFHWKQALRRKMLDYGINKEAISELLATNGLLELLTVIPIAEIENRGIPFIRATYNVKEDSLERFDKFWTYFRNNFFVRYPPEDWNINGKYSKDLLINRTNNPSERYNRTLQQERYNKSHPNVDTFVRELRELSNFITVFTHKSRIGELKYSVK
jgi:hypothetical protein